MANYRPVIGLEIHVELKTKSKMFCQCLADYFGKKPNTHTCPVCLGLPGALPVPNKKAIEWTILLGKAFNCSINKVSKFDRKHYFYPDLPKGYQISQYDEPIATKGSLKLKIKSEKLKIEEKNFHIHRVHLEEDTGKLIHSGSDTLIDFNRSGVPLVEIVTEPDFDNAEDVKRFLEELQVIIRYLDISDADMEKGSMRLEPNVSVKIKRLTCLAGRRALNIKRSKDGLPNYKVEVKNINSFRFVKQAIEYEIERQIGLLEKGETPKQETRGFDPGKGITYSQRTKEEAHDYRYFPEPDIPPLQFSDEYIKSIEKQLPELPSEKLERYIKEFNIRYQDAFVLTRDKRLAAYFQDVSSKFIPSNSGQSSKLQLKIESYEQKIANLIVNKKISLTLSVDEFVKKAVNLLSPKQVDEKMFDESIHRIIVNNKKAVEDYKKGKQNALMFLVGQVMKKFNGKVDPKVVIEKLRQRLV